MVHLVRQNRLGAPHTAPHKTPLILPATTFCIEEIVLHGGRDLGGRDDRPAEVEPVAPTSALT
jgi:hypothetical protein